MPKAIVANHTQTGRCHRCGGVMVEEPVFEIGSIDWHCLSCGERVDPVILAHRQKGLTPVEPEGRFTGKGKVRLN